MSEAKGARSVYLNYDYPESTLYHNEILVEEACNGTYFCVCGFHIGYFGIQQRNTFNDNIALFSIWDSKNDNPDTTSKKKQAHLIKQNPGAKVQRFFGEGSGIQCVLKYTWEIKEIYQFEVKSAKTEDGRINYAAFIKKISDKDWIHLATYSCLTNCSGIKGFYSFIEDFRMDGRTPNMRRSAQFINGFSIDHNGVKCDFRSAKFTAVEHPLNNINAELVSNGFLLETGGDIVSKTSLNSILKY